MKFNCSRLKLTLFSAFIIESCFNDNSNVKY